MYIYYQIKIDMQISERQLDFTISNKSVFF